METQCGNAPWAVIGRTDYRAQKAIQYRLVLSDRPGGDYSIKLPDTPRRSEAPPR